LYARVAGEVAAAHPGGKVLEVGSGPGRLAVRLAREAPGMTLTGVDISDAMVERAARRAAGAGLSERVRFEVGDVAALPISDGEFDGVVSTLSLHHWSDPDSGLDEIYRVLKPGEPVAQAGLAGEERDPVCGMRVDPLVPLEYGGESYHFCSESCREQFKATPEYFLRAMSYRS
jgi:ubiquinone/menaquinone biosynthesis C-methylase UbiE